MHHRLPPIRPLLHRQNRLPDLIQPLEHMVLLVLDLPRRNERRDRLVEGLSPFRLERRVEEAEDADALREDEVHFLLVYR
jgi:hypothetical protein